MTSAIGLNIGGQPIRLSLNGAADRLKRRLSKHFESHLALPAEDAVCITVATYSKRRRFGWTDRQIQPFAACFEDTLARLPRKHPIEERAAKAQNILRHINPDDPALRQLNGFDSRSLLFSMVGETLFLFRPQAHAAVALLPKTFRVDPMLAGILNAVMFVLSYLLIQSGGLLLHGSAVERDGATALFIGQSGSGKTTTARLCRPDTCFADDGVVVVRESNQFLVHSSPFRQIEKTGDSSNGHRGTIRKVFLLEKETFERVAELEKHVMMRFIMQHAIHFFKFLDDNAARKGFETVKLLLEKLPVYRLQFTRSSDVWNLISEIDHDRRSHVRPEG